MARRTKRNLGIIGLGIIGSRVADHLRRKGLPVFVWNRTPRPVPNFVGSPTELAELCDVIQIFVSDDDAVLEMVQRMKSTLNKQHIIVVNSTVSPDTKDLASEPLALWPRVAPLAFATTDDAVISPPKSETAWISPEALEVAAVPALLVAEVVSEPVLTTEPSDGYADPPPKETRYCGAETSPACAPMYPGATTRIAYARAVPPALEPAPPAPADPRASRSTPPRSRLRADRFPTSWDY